MRRRFRRGVGRTRSADDLQPRRAAVWRSQLRGLAVLNHDDDILWYQLYADGKLVDEYDSTPGYFDSAAEPSAPAGGDARKLCSALGSTNAAEVERILRKSGFDDDGYTFAFERHTDLVRALGITEFGVGTSYASFENDELPAGLSVADVIRA